MTGRLAGRVALVTGGGWNIGRSCAVRFASEGAHVVVAGRNEERLEESCALIHSAGGSASALRCDVTDLAQVEALVARTQEAVGPVDVLAAIAGGGGGYEAIDTIDPAWWADVIRLNLVGTFHSVRAVLPAMRARGGGSILLCTGGGAFFPLEGVEATAYATAKAGLCRLTDQLALELLETGVRVNCLSPELTWSEETRSAIEADEARTGAPHPARAANHSPEEAAELAAWLVSEDSAPLTGRTVSVNDDWWRDPARVSQVCTSMHAYTLRRVDLGGTPG